MNPEFTPSAILRGSNGTRPAAPSSLLRFPTPCGVPAPCGRTCELQIGPERHALLSLGSLSRLAVLAVAPGWGSFRRQADELFAQMACIVGAQRLQHTPTTMTVFLKDEFNEAECRQVLRGQFGDWQPVTTFVTQPPCSGAELAVELWAAGGPSVKIERFGSDLLSVESDGIRWIHCGGITGTAASKDPYQETLSGFERMRQRLAEAGANFDQVVRTWLYVNQITEGPEGRQRYQELNRARTDFFRQFQFGAKRRAQWAPDTIYPASTGIGTRARRIALGCLALDSQRSDVFLMPLENPQQTPAYSYEARYSPQTPKFSRAMAVVQGHFVATLVSGTASIVNSRTYHKGDIIGQTEQTIDNIEQLIGPANFAAHELPGMGATLRDIAKLRVYVKNREDYRQCRAICEKRLPHVPAIYLQADVCRPDLLVEIEAVAFSQARGLRLGSQELPKGSHLLE